MTTAIAQQTQVAQVTKIFLTAFAAATPIEFSENWANGTGYYNGAVAGDDAPKLEVGQIVAAQSPMPNNRKIIIIGTPLGNLVVFQRYTDGDRNIHTFNSSLEFSSHIGKRLDRPLNAEDMHYLVGDHLFPGVCPNVGTSLQSLAKAIATFSQGSRGTC